MTVSPLSLRDSATLREAIAFLIDRGIGGAPVIDEAGRPVGVLTQTDILVHDRENVEHIGPPEYESGGALAKGRLGGVPDRARGLDAGRDMMTPAVFSVGAYAPAARAIAEMRDLNVHRLFVVDDNGVLVGVITALDVLRHLRLPGM